MKKCVESLQKQTKGVTFFSQNSQLTFSLPKEKYFHIKDKNRPLLRKKLNFLKNKIRSFTFREKKVDQGRLALTIDIRLQFRTLSRE